MPSKLAILSLAILLFFNNCGDDHPIKKPDNLLSEELYEDVFYEISMLRVLQNYYPPQDTVDSLQQLILEKYQISEQDYIDSFRYYQSRLGKQLEITERTLSKIQANLKALNREDSLRGAVADSLAKAASDSLK